MTNVTVSIPADAAADVFHLKAYLENRLLGAEPWALQSILDAVAASRTGGDPFRREFHVDASDSAVVIGDEYAAWLACREAEADKPWVQRAVELAQWTSDQMPVMLADFEAWRNEYAERYQQDRDAWWVTRRERSRDEFYLRRRDVA